MTPPWQDVPGEPVLIYAHATFEIIQPRYLTMTDDPNPREDDLTDPAKQDPSTDLPSPEEGNDDEDDTEDEKQDQQVG